MNTHTPGPWFVRLVDQDLPSIGYQVEHETGGLRSIVADCRDCAVCEEHGSAQSNARLIAAAPDLLAALKALISTSADVFEHAKSFDRLDGSPVVTEGDMIQLDKARLAINKASSL